MLLKQWCFFFIRLPPMIDPPTQTSVVVDRNPGPLFQSPLNLQRDGSMPFCAFECPKKFLHGIKIISWNVILEERQKNTVTDAGIWTIKLPMEHYSTQGNYVISDGSSPACLCRFVYTIHWPNVPTTLLMGYISLKTKDGGAHPGLIFQVKQCRLPPIFL